jgi:prepilin-type processing-associated H-X9-DG protein
MLTPRWGSSDNVRWGLESPQMDTRRESHPAAFGSGHRGGWNVAYADGSVRTLSFEIDAGLHRQLSNRDGISRGEMAGIPPK